MFSDDLKIEFLKYGIAINLIIILIISVYKTGIIGLTEKQYFQAGFDFKRASDWRENARKAKAVGTMPYRVIDNKLK